MAAQPQPADAYDSLVEGYQEIGNNELAIRNYQKSLEINPNNKNAGTKLKELTHR